jgi:LysM repeat protein
MSTVSTIANHRTSPRTAPRRPHGGARRPAQQATVRLTRRGRLVVTLLLLALVLVLFTVFSGYSAATGEAGSPQPTRTVVVDEGDTLWGIASTVAEPGGTRELVHEIQELNSLPGPELVEGQELAVPVG